MSLYGGSVSMVRPTVHVGAEDVLFNLGDLVILAWGKWKPVTPHLLVSCQHDEYLPSIRLLFDIRIFYDLTPSCLPFKCLRLAIHTDVLWKTTVPLAGALSTFGYDLLSWAPKCRRKTGFMLRLISNISFYKGTISIGLGKMGNQERLDRDE